MKTIYKSYIMKKLPDCDGCAEYKDIIVEAESFQEAEVKIKRQYPDFEITVIEVTELDFIK